MEELEELGYTFQFLANKNVFAGPANTSTDGALIDLGTANIDNFKYQVKVSLDGEVVAESDLVEVTVKDEANIVTSISAIELVLTQNGEEVTVESGKLAVGDDDNYSVAVKVMGRTLDMAADADDANITSKVELSTDKVSIATLAADGTVSLNGAKGDVTITAEADDITESIVVNAGNTARAVSADNSTVTPASVELAQGDDVEVTVVLKDQYGDLFVTLDGKVVTEAALNADGDTIAVAVTDSEVDDEDYSVTFILTAASDEAGTGKVVVKHLDTELAEINLTVKAPGEVAVYRLVPSAEELDLMGDSAPTLTLALKGYDEEGLLKETVTISDATTYSFASSNEDVATVDVDGTVTGHEAGTTTVKVFLTEDAFETAVAEVEITVVDSTPSIADVTVTDVEEITVAGNLDLNEIFEITAVDPEGEEVEVNAFTDGDITVSEGPAVKIGEFLVVKVGAEEVTVGEITDGKIAIGGTGEATINIAVLVNGEIVTDINVEVAIDPAE